MIEKNKLRISREKLFTLVLPLLTFIGSIFLVFVFALFPDLIPYEEKRTAGFASGKFDPNEKVAYFNNNQIPAPDQPLPLPNFLSEDRVLSAVDRQVREERWIEIDLSQQRLYAHQGGEIVYEFPISSGKWAPTPTGTFRIWAKLKYTLMHGGSKNDNTYYYLPNVPYTQYFYHGFGLHGTYWHNNFGHPMSHGCINMYTPDAETIFYWTDPIVAENQWVVYPTRNSPGTKIVIHGAAPNDN